MPVGPPENFLGAKCTKLNQALKCMGVEKTTGFSWSRRKVYVRQERVKLPAGLGLGPGLLTGLFALICHFILAAASS